MRMTQWRSWIRTRRICEYYYRYGVAQQVIFRRRIFGVGVLWTRFSPDNTSDSPERTFP
jgi:hypothetical protein